MVNSVDLNEQWLKCMRRGDFAAAWHLSDMVMRQRRPADCSHQPRHLQYVWSGTPLTGKRVLVRCYHGLGDTIQFVRLLRPLRERTAQITLWVQPKLLELVRTVRGIDRLLPLHDGSPQVEYDADIELMEVAHALRLMPEQIPQQIPYIYVPPAARPAEACLPRDGVCNVGIAWQSGAWMPQRSVPTAALAPLARIAGVRWYSLQFPPQPLPFEAAQLVCKDIAAMAVRMLALDLVICVDTTVAHLAGALGLPTWTLLHHDCDWRWMSTRSRTPWYPTMRLLRQPEPGDWTSVIEQVRTALARRLTRIPAPYIR